MAWKDLVSPWHLVLARLPEHGRKQGLTQTSVQQAWLRISHIQTIKYTTALCTPNRRATGDASAGGKNRLARIHDPLSTSTSYNPRIGLAWNSMYSTTSQPYSKARHHQPRNVVQIITPPAPRFDSHPLSLALAQLEDGNRCQHGSTTRIKIYTVHSTVQGYIGNCSTASPRNWPVASYAAESRHSIGVNVCFLALRASKQSGTVIPRCRWPVVPD